MNIHIDLTPLRYTFTSKPVLVGGKAMEYYGIRNAGNDIDFIACEKDVKELLRMYPDRVKDLWGDIGVCPMPFEIWKSIFYLSYDDVREHAIEEQDFFVVSIEKLLLMKVVAMEKEKYRKDTELIIQYLRSKNEKTYEHMNRYNKQFLSDIHSIVYIEKSGPHDI